MDNYEDIYRNTFGHEKESIPAEEEKALWNSIVDELGEDHSKRKAFFFFFKRRAFLVIATLLITSMLVISKYYPGYEKAIHKEQAPVALQQQKQLQKEQSERSEQISKRTVEEKIVKNIEEQRDSKRTIEKNTIKGDSNNINATKKDRKISSIADQNSNNSMRYESLGQEVIPHLNSTATERSKEMDEKDNHVLDQINTTDIPDLSNDRLNVENSMLPLVYQRIIYDLMIDRLELLENNNEEIPTWQTSIELFSGLNRSSVQYSRGSSMDLIDLKNKTERGYYGYNLGLNAQFVYQNKWLISTGVMYHVDRTIFDYEIDRTRSINKDDLVYGILIDYNSKELMEEYIKDSIIINSGIYRLKQINQFQSIIIPIQLGWMYSNKNMTYGVKAGLHTRIRIGQQGKLLDLNQDVSTIESESNLFIKNINVAYSLSPFIGYRVSATHQLGLSYDLLWYRHRVNSTNLLLNHYVQNVRFGISHQL